MSSTLHFRARTFLSLFTLFALLSCAMVIFAQKDEDTIRVETTMVTVPIRVFDKDGRSIAGLTKEDFRIFEDKSAQEIVHFGSDNSPVTIALMLDVSDSARFKFTDIQDAAIAFAGKLREGDRLMIFVFDRLLTLIYEGPATKDQDITRVVRRINKGGGTALYDSVENVANRELRKLPGKKAIVLLTDGVDTESKQDWDDNLRAMRESDAPVYAIQYETINEQRDNSSSSDPMSNASTGTPKGETLAVAYERAARYLSTLTSDSGGRMYKADNVPNLAKRFAEIADELSRTYSLSYYPPDDVKKDKVRKIKVELTSKQAKLRYRTGYLPSANTK